MKAKPYSGTLILGYDRELIDPRARLFLGLKPPENPEDKLRQRRRVGANCWTPPGGALEKLDSNLKHCAQREFREESGWYLPVSDFAKVGILKGYVNQTDKVIWRAAQLVWVVHIYQTIIPEDIRDKFICGEGFVKVDWFPVLDLPWTRMMDSDKVWMPKLVNRYQMNIKLLFDGRVGKFLDYKLTPTSFD